MPLWSRILGGVLVFVTGFFLLTSALHGIKDALFGNPEVKREQGNTEIAKEQTKAESTIAGKTIENVHERDVYREHVTNIVHEAQGSVNNAWKGETVGKDVDAAGADALCRLSDSLCRGRDPAAQVQPVRGPVPPANGAR